MRFILLIMGFLLCAGVSAQGKILHDSACLQCHASLTEGKPEQLYQRADRRVKTLEGLTKRVKNCAIAADANWNEQQREAVVEYLNSSFYQF